MVWVALIFHAKTPICLISNKMSTEYYIDSLDNVLIPFMDEHRGEDVLFQQDNATIYVSRPTKE